MNDKTEAPDALSMDGTNPLAYLKEKRQAVVGFETRSAEPRRTPKGTRVQKQTPDEAIFQIRAAKQFWWWFGPAIAIGISFFMIPFSFVLIAAMYDPGANTIGIILLLVCLGGMVASYLMTRVWLTVLVRKDQMRVGAKVYDRKYVSGFSIGYSLKTDDKALMNDFKDQTLGLSGLRLRYGRWGDDIPYLVNQYHAAEIVIWANEIIASVGAPAPKEHDPKAGRTKDMF